MAKILVLKLDGTGDTRELPSGELSVGRASDNDWVLGEPGKMSISRRHCRFTMGAEGPAVTDLGSSNGTQVDGRALVPHVPMTLQGGEVIVIGSRRLTVQVTEPWTLAPAPAPPRLNMFDPVPGAAGPGMPVIRQEVRRQPVPPTEPDTLFGAPDPGNLFGEDDTPLPSPEFLQKDPMASAFNEKLKPIRRGSVPPGPQRLRTKNGTPPQLEALPPRGSTPQNLDAPPEPSRPVTRPADPLGSSDPLQAVAKPQAPAAFVLAADALAGEERNPFGPGSAEPAPLVSVSGPGGGRSQAAFESGRPASVDNSRETADVREAMLLAAFLDGAGLQPSVAQGRDPKTFLREAGQVFAHLANGLRKLLIIRALIKDQAGLERTQISASLNNPLKLSVSEHEATAALLGGRPEEGYLSPVAAVDAGFRDLEAHELAVLDGAQAAVDELLERFNPAQLERALDDAGMLLALIQGGRRARLWELYQERYDEIAKSAHSHFMGRLDEAFHEAYARKSSEMHAHEAGPVGPTPRMVRSKLDRS